MKVHFCSINSRKICKKIAHKIDARRVVELGPGFRSAKTAPHKKILCSVNRNFELMSFDGFSEVFKLRHDLQGLRLPGSCSGGVSEARFRRKIKNFRKEILPPQGWPGIIPTSIWCEMSAMRDDFGALCGDFQRNSLRKCTTARFRGGRLGGLPAFLGRDFGEKSRFSGRKPCRPRGGLGSFPLAFGAKRARFEVIAARNDVSFTGIP